MVESNEIFKIDMKCLDNDDKAISWTALATLAFKNELHFKGTLVSIRFFIRGPNQVYSQVSNKRTYSLNHF